MTVWKGVGEMSILKVYDAAGRGLKMSLDTSPVGGGDTTFVDSTYLGENRYWEEYRIAGDPMFDTGFLLMYDGIYSDYVERVTYQRGGDVILDISNTFVTALDLVSDGLKSLFLGNDRMVGNKFSDKILGFSGSDKIFGLSADDELRGMAGNDVLKGGGGNDILFGEGGKDQLNGGVGVDTLKGGKGSDVLKGGGGGDFLAGQGGADKLFGGSGADTLSGGGGRDIFIFNKVSGKGNIITDFSLGKDYIKVTNGATEVGDLSISNSGADVLIAFSNVDILVLGASVDDFSAGDVFIF